MKLVRREYDYHVDWRLKDSEEPPQPFREWTPTTPREPLDLTEEEEVQHAAYSEFMTKVSISLQLIIIKTDLLQRIRRWLNYRAHRLMKKYTQARGANLDDPFTVLLAKLTGVTKPKKARQACQHWSHFNYEKLIKPTVVAEWEAFLEANALPTFKGVTAGFRGAITLHLFKKLPADEQMQWARDAKAFSELQRKEYEATLKRPFPTDPASRQRSALRLLEYNC